MTRRVNKVLVVDDNHTAALALGKLLEQDGYTVETAFDGETALAIAEEAHPDAIILDLNLPGKNGYEVVRTLRRDLYSTALFIALSGYGQQEHKRMAREAGFDYHLTKPILVSEIEELLNIPKAGARSVGHPTGRI